METEKRHEPQIIPFASASAWEMWLSGNTDTTQGVWLKIAKKASGIATVTYEEALDVALCYGWIDGQRKTFDADHFIQHFTPRRPRSLWSKRNVGKVAALIVSGKMQPAGLLEIETAQKDGRWDAAYDSPKDMVVPDDFVEAVKENELAQAAFNRSSKAEKYSIAWRLQTAKTAKIRQKRFIALLASLENAETV